MKNLYLTITLMMFAVTLSTAQTTIYPSQDMTTNDGSSSMFPNEGQLWIANWNAMQNYHQTLIQFDLSSVSQTQVESAFLNIYQFFHAPDGSPTPSKIYAITEDWDESSWSTSTNVSHADNEYATPEFTSQTGWYNIDITDLVNAWLDGTVENKGLVIIANSGTKFAQFYSKETTDTDKKPYLEIQSSNGVETELLSNNVTIAPNPAKDYTSIQLYVDKTEDISFNIVDMSGKQLLQIKKKQYTAGTHNQIIDFSNLKSGMYVLQICTDSDVSCKKIIVRK